MTDFNEKLHCNNLISTVKFLNDKLPNSENSNYTGDGAEEAEGATAGTPMNERNPTAAASCSSKKRSSGALKAPWTQTVATPIMRADISTDPTLVKKITAIVERIRPPRVSYSEKDRPKRTRGRSDGRKR